MSINIKRNQLKRVVIVGGGLGGLRLAEDLSKANLQVVLIDKNNFHQFPPLIYQIASAGIDPSSISFPFRQIFRKRKNTSTTGSKHKNAHTYGGIQSKKYGQSRQECREESGC